VAAELRSLLLLLCCCSICEFVRATVSVDGEQMGVHDDGRCNCHDRSIKIFLTFGGINLNRRYGGAEEVGGEIAPRGRA